MSFAPLISGVIVALWIPTDASGEIIEDALASHIRYLKSAGVAGFLALGSTGEFVHLDAPRRTRVIHRVAEWAAPLPVVANVSDVNPNVSRQLARDAVRAGCVGISLLPPWYYHLTQADQLEYFLRVSEVVDLPAVLYNFPERVGNRIGLETVAAFAAAARMAGIKQSGAEWEYHRDLIALGEERKFAVYTGADTRLRETMTLGCAGTISGLANFLPEPLVAIARDLSSPSRADESIRQVAGAFHGLQFPLDVAAGMRAKGFEIGAFKQAVSPATAALFEASVADLQKLLTPR
jgi:4-hydroxy-tetrahydrodipicolinate synthase